MIKITFFATLIILLMTFASISHAERKWMKVGVTSGHTHYLKLERFQKKDGNVHWLDLTNNLKPNKSGNASVHVYRQDEQYLNAMYTPELTPSPNAANFATNLRWCNSAEGMTMQPINTYVVGTIFLLPVSRNEENAARTFKLLNRTHGTAETPIEGWNFIAGDLTAADRITGHLVIISRRLGANLNECPNLNAYANRLEIRAAFKIAPPA